MKRKKRKKKSFLTKIKQFILKTKKDLYDEVDEEITNDSSFSIAEVMVIVCISILFGVIIGYIITYSRNPVNHVSRNKNLNEIVGVYNNIVEDYYGELDQDKLSDAAINGMIESLEDPYSNYMDTDTTNSFNESVDGEFVGIGVTVMFSDDANKIIEVLKDSPAAKAGLKVDDVIIKVDGKDVHNVYGDELAKLIRGKVGTKVKVTVRRDQKEKTFSVKRDKIEIESVISTRFDQNNKFVGYMDIDIFAANTFQQFNDALKDLEKKKIDSLIIDVRDNPGGHLTQVKEILSLFFDKKTVLYQVESKNKKEKVYSLSKGKKNYPVVVLIDNNSASAAEILASCFQDNYKKATIIGTNSYGKGTVQKSKMLSDGTSVKYTVEKWLTAKGKWINEIGVTPDNIVEQGTEYYDNPTYENDKQLQAALEMLTK